MKVFVISVLVILVGISIGLGLAVNSANKRIKVIETKLDVATTSFNYYRIKSGCLEEVIYGVCYRLKDKKSLEICRDSAALDMLVDTKVKLSGIEIEVNPLDVIKKTNQMILGDDR